jgi:DNA repair protein RecO (recombination protein O)
MTARASHKTEAFVLKSFSYGESDLIVTFFSRDYGKVKGIAKGAKRSQKRFVNVFEPFSLTSVNFTIKNRDALAFIDACDVIDPYAPLRQNLEKSLVASYFTDLVDHFSPEGKVNERLFALLADFLSLIARENTSDAILRFFEIRLLKYAGFEPTLGACIRCKSPLANGASYSFFAREGGIICPFCMPSEAPDLKISAGTIRTLILGRDMDIEKIRTVIFPSPLAAEARHMMRHFITHVLGKEIKSLNVLEQVRRYCL